MKELIAKNQKELPRFSTRAEKCMEDESQGYITSDTCLRSNGHKVKKLVKGYK